MTDEREKDIQALCAGILSMEVESTGDYGAGGQCPFCYMECGWNAKLSEVNHKPDCIYLIARDLSTNTK